jgi:hypothetical protein
MPVWGLRGKDKQIVNKDNLKEELIHSYEYCDKFGKHTDKLGLYVIEIANIMIKRNTNAALPDWKLEHLRSEVVYQMFREISREGDKSNGNAPFRTEFEAGRIDNVFNYFCQVAKYSLWENIRHEKRCKETEEQFAEMFHDVFSATIRAEAEDNSLDLGSITGFDYNGGGDWSSDW